MAGPPSNAGWRHPFHSRERVNFPDFSPIFSRHVTPESQVAHLTTVLSQRAAGAGSFGCHAMAAYIILTMFVCFPTSPSERISLVHRSYSKTGEAQHPTSTHIPYYIPSQKPADIATDPFTLVKTNGVR